MKGKMGIRSAKYFIVLLIAIISGLYSPSSANAGELFTISFRDYDIHSRGLFTSSGGYYRNQRSATIRRTKLSTFAARRTMPKLESNVNPRNSYEQQRVKAILKEQLVAQKQYKKELKAYERQLKLQKREALKQQRDAQRQLEAKRKVLERKRKALAAKESTVVEIKENTANSEQSAGIKAAKSNSSGLSFWQRLKQAIFGK